MPHKAGTPANIPAKAGTPTTIPALLTLFVLIVAAPAAEVESRVLTRYLPQDGLEESVRHEGWTEVKLEVKGGIRKGDVIRIWAGGSIDRGNGDKPGDNVNGPDGARDKSARGALSANPDHRFALLFKTSKGVIVKALPAGKPLEIQSSKDKEQLFLGFNDEKGRYHDNHLGKGRRHERDPLWVRIEVVRTVVD